MMEGPSPSALQEPRTFLHRRCRKTPQAALRPNGLHSRATADAAHNPMTSRTFPYFLGAPCEARHGSCTNHCRLFREPCDATQHSVATSDPRAFLLSHRQPSAAQLNLETKKRALAPRVWGLISTETW